MGILTRLTSSACLNQVSENIYANFFPSFLSSLLNPGEVGKATCNKSTSNMVQGKYLYSAQIQRSPGLGKGSWNRQLPPHCPVSASPCLWHQAQGQQAGKHLALPCSIPAQALWSRHCHPSHGEGSLMDCTLQDAVCNVKFQVQGFPSLVPGTGA